MSSASAAAGVPGRGLKMKLKLSSKPTSSTSFIIRSKSSSVSPGKPTMKSLEIAMPGPDRAQLADRALVFERGVAALHRRQDAVAAVLHRQVQVVDELGDPAVGVDQALREFLRMAGRVADALDAGISATYSSSVAKSAISAVSPIAPR